MLKYLIIPLASNVPSICRYTTDEATEGLIPLDILRAGINFALKHNLIIQYVWPEEGLPDAYMDAIASSNHVNIAPIGIARKEDISIIRVSDDADVTDRTLLCTLTPDEFVFQTAHIIKWLRRCGRLNLMIHGYLCDSAKESAYSEALQTVADTIYEQYAHGHMVQFNLLTDRILLTGMNNCNAGIENITLGCDGKFYLCPGFYHDGSEATGDLNSGLRIPNRHLLELDYAPVCRICDAYHCTRCVHDNRKHTLEVNTPGHKQCVMSHIERNVSSRLCKKLVEAGFISPKALFSETDCLDPFYKLPRIILK